MNSRTLSSGQYGVYRSLCGSDQDSQFRIIETQPIFPPTIDPVCMSTQLFESCKITRAALMHANADPIYWASQCRLCTRDQTFPFADSHSKFTKVAERRSLRPVNQADGNVVTCSKLKSN